MSRGLGDVYKRQGELKGKIKISAHKFTASAKSAIEAAGGEAISI